MSFSTKKTQYRPDLDEFITQCELNYALIQRLLPDWLSFVLGASSNDAIKDIEWVAQNELLRLSLKVIDIATYTTTAKLSIRSNVLKDKLASGNAHQLDVIVRLYHDARMMEVMEGSGPGALKAAYPSTDNERAVDEKQQINRFIGESLKVCIYSKVEQLEKNNG
ncbi:MAG: DUF1249 domain-containing protein [Gammaproteobacteria bacterium]|nr:DUF1249 domain-containing protein [Gammaproteobacteria bacterium]